MSTLCSVLSTCSAFTALLIALIVKCSYLCRSAPPITALSKLSGTKLLHLSFTSLPLAHTHGWYVQRNQRMYWRDRHSADITELITSFYYCLTALLSSSTVGWGRQEVSRSLALSHSSALSLSPRRIYINTHTQMHIQLQLLLGLLFTLLFIRESRIFLNLILLAWFFHLTENKIISSVYWAWLLVFLSIFL